MVELDVHQQPLDLENRDFARAALEAVALQNAAMARESFKVFRQTIRPGMLFNPFVNRLCRELQHFHEAFERGDRPKLALCTPPQHGKSIIAEDFAAWVGGKRPDHKTIYASYSEDLGALRNLNLQRVFTSRRFQEVFPRFLIGAPGWTLNTNLIEYVGHQGSFRNTTTGGGVTGLELHLGIVDDFVKGRAEANSKLIRDRTWSWFSDDFLTRFSKDSALLIIATRWHIDDLLGRLKKKLPELRMLEFPALAEKDEWWRKKGEPLFPEHKPMPFLMERKALMSEASWQAEYQQHPYLVGGGVIPVEKLQVISVFDRREVVASVLSVDKAGTEGGDGAYTAIVLMHKMKDGRFIIERVVRGHWGALDREKQIKIWADHDKENLRFSSVRFTVVIEQEPGSGGKESAEATIRNLAGHICIADRPGAGRSKEIRCEPFAAQVQGGNVSLVAQHPNWIPEFLEEAESWPHSPHLDQVDAAAQAFHHLTNQVGYDIEIYRRVNA
jgi:predicted phage terminase large subunit-like protein